MTGRITFFRRLERQIRSGKKTATIRDKSDSHLTIGQVVDAFTHEDGRKICTIEIVRIDPVKFSELSRLHAKAENLPFVFLLKRIIRKIYPNEEDLYFIGFRVLEDTDDLNEETP